MTKTGARSTHLPGPGPLRTLPNLITILRTLGSAACALTALVVDDRLGWLIAGYLIYWIGDSLDGLAARLLDQETRAGAVFDIACDRLNTALLAAGLMLEQPDLVPAIGLFLLNFMVVDQLLSLSFLLWPLVSPNYFGQVDATVFAWNWSHPAKALNNVGIVLVVVIGNLPLALLVVTLQLTVKIASARRVAQLIGERRPAPAGV